MFPRHILNKHPEKLIVRPIPSDHCLYAYVKNGVKEIDFCVCLTCKKGTIEDTAGINSTRWLTLHSRSNPCKENHVAAVGRIKAYIATHNTITVGPPPVTSVVVPTPAPIHTCPTVSEDKVFDSFWNKAKSTVGRRELMEFVESNAEAAATLCDSDEEEPYIFSGKDLLLQLIDASAGQRRDLNKCKTRVGQLENTVEEQKSRIEHLEDTCAMLKEQIKYLTESHEEFKLLHSQCKPA